MKSLSVGLNIMVDLLHEKGGFELASGTQGRDIALIVLIILVILILLGGGGMMGFGMMGPWMIGMMGGYFNPLWGILMVVFWVLVIGGVALLAIWLLRSSGTTTALIGPTGRAEEAPVEILKRRYAKGEITKEQYEQMRKDLE